MTNKYKDCEFVTKFKLKGVLNPWLCKDDFCFVFDTSGSFSRKQKRGFQFKKNTNAHFFLYEGMKKWPDFNL